MSRRIGIHEARFVVEDARDFGRVAVMLGGFSNEREVSLATGNAVLKALQSRGIDARPWDPADHVLSEFAQAGFDRVWIALHGPGGEDGSLQGALQWLDTPFTGSGVMASAIAMDKIRSKHLFESCGIPTPDFGMTKVFEADDLADAVSLALNYGGVALAERCIVGDEITVGVLQGEALPSIRIETPRVFYDYRAKYESDRTQYHCPGTSDARLEQRYAELAVAAFGELGCSGWGRVDFMVGADGEPQVLEVNTVPGMTSHSLVPMAAKQVGIDFEELCWRILETSVGADVRATHTEVAANDA
jgi:D-alanine-D-alanine ligase